MNQSNAVPHAAPASDDAQHSSELLEEAAAEVLALLEEAVPLAAEDEMEAVGRLLGRVMDRMREVAPLPSTAAWKAVHRQHELLQHEVDAAGERIRAQLGEAGGGRKAASRYGATVPSEKD
jgi:hypothetical protein